MKTGPHERQIPKTIDYEITIGEYVDCSDEDSTGKSKSTSASITVKPKIPDDGQGFLKAVIGKSSDYRSIELALNDMSSKGQTILTATVKEENDRHHPNPNEDNRVCAIGALAYRLAKLLSNPEIQKELEKGKIHY